MDPQLTAYTTLVCTSGVLHLFLCIYVFVKRRNYTSIAKFFILSTAATTIYCFSYAFSLTSTTLDQMKFWNVIQYLGMPFAPPLGLLFVMQYLGINITRKRIIALLTIPVLSLLMDATNELHHLHYRSYEIDQVLGAPYNDIEVGIWFIVHGVFLCSCMFGAIILLLSRWKETAKSYRPQLFSLICAQAIPMVTAFLYLIGVTPEGIDPVPMVVWLSSLLFLWSVNSSRMLMIVPIAKETIFNSMKDGVIVLDESYRLVEFNQASKSMFIQLDRSMFGQHLDQAWLMLFGQLFPFNQETAAGTQELQLTPLGSEHMYQVRTSLLQHSNHNSAGILIIITDITEINRLQLKLEHQAYYDELTQIYNRRAFFQQCEPYYVAAKKDASPFTMILMDIDYFKRVNDAHGHLVGDQLLVHFVQVCQARLNEGDLFARYGGEEFVLALKGYTASEAEVLANQIREDVEKQPLVTNDVVVPVTSSFGVAEAERGSEETIYQILHKADEALYSAKREGRNLVHVYGKVMNKVILKSVE